jgi:UDP-glucose 4-epimerase
MPGRRLERLCLNSQKICLILQSKPADGRLGPVRSILRFGFVYGEGDGHIGSRPRLLAEARLHPAQRMSMVHHVDIGTAVNIGDDAPTSLHELVELAGAPMAPVAEPLASPWRLHMDVSLARRLGFQPVVRTVRQAAELDVM